MAISPLAGKPAPKDVIYAESFKDENHLNAIVSEAQKMVDRALQHRTQEVSR